MMAGRVAFRYALKRVYCESDQDLVIHWVSGSLQDWIDWLLAGGSLSRFILPSPLGVPAPVIMQIECFDHTDLHEDDDSDDDDNDNRKKGQ